MLAVRERGGGTAEEVRLAIGLEAVPVVGDARLRTFEADVIRDPIAVSDDLAPNRLVPDLPCRARDLVDPSGPCGGRVEVEENVVRRRPQRPAWSREGEAALETTDRAQLVRQLDQARKRDGETAAHLRLVSVAVDAVVFPLLQRRAAPHAERPRAGEAAPPQVLLD